MVSNLLIFTAALLILFHDAESESVSNDIFNHLGSKTPYRFKYHKDDSKIKFPGCTSKKIWMVIRHGSRLPSDKDIEGMNSTLKDLSEQILLGHKIGKGQLNKNQLSKLKNWSSTLDVTKAKDLVDEGRDEMTQLARRMQKRFPSVIKSKYSNDSFEFRFTPTERAEESAKSFAIGLFNKDAPKVFMTKTSKGDPVLRFYKQCDRWQKQVKKNPKTYAEQTKLAGSVLMNQTLDTISKKLGLNVTIDLAAANLMYKACAYETAWWKGYVAPWCFAFDKDTIKVLEYYYELKHYFMDGYGSELTKRTACESVKQMIDNLSGECMSYGYPYAGPVCAVGASHKTLNFFADVCRFHDIFFTEKSMIDEFIDRTIIVWEFSDPPYATFLFAHSGTLLKILTHMGLYKPDQPLSGDSVPEQRVWRLSDIDCFASNLAFVLFECKDGDHLLTLHQERVVKLPCCEKELCPLDHLKRVFHDTIHYCDHAAICRFNSSNDEL